MKFDFSQFEQFVGKEIVVYNNYSCTYYEGIITDWDVEKKFNGKVIVNFEIEITLENGKEIEPIKSGVDTRNFKKTWGFKGTSFAKNLKNVYSHKYEKCKKIEAKKKELKYPECLRKAYKEAYEAYQKSNGSIYYVVFNLQRGYFDFVSTPKTEIFFSDRKAYISTTNKNEYYWCSMKLVNLGNKFFFTEKECLKRVEELNELLWIHASLSVQEYIKENKIEYFETGRIMKNGAKILLTCYYDQAHKKVKTTVVFPLADETKRVF